MGRRAHPRRLVLAVLVAVSAFLGPGACSEPVGNVDPFIQPELVDFNGRFSVTHSFSVPGTAVLASCTGTADLDSDLGLGFSGTIDIEASGPCADITNRVGQILGAVRDESISFSVSGLPDPMAAIGCSITGGPLVFDGTYTTRAVAGDVALVQTLRGTRDLRAECDDQEVDARWEIRASRR